MVKSKFHNLKALKKTFKKFGTTGLIDAGKPAYTSASQRIHRKAKSNAPRGKGKKGRGGGSLKNNIRWIGENNPKASRGALLKYTIYSSSIQDMLITHGVPDNFLSATQATERSRTIRGIRHRVKAGYNYTKARQRTKKGNPSSKLPIGKDGRPWAWGERDANPFMTEGQDFDKVLTNMANDTGNNILKEFDKMFSGFAK